MRYRSPTRANLPVYCRWNWSIHYSFHLKITFFAVVARDCRFQLLNYCFECESFPYLILVPEAILRKFYYPESKCSILSVRHWRKEIIRLQISQIYQFPAGVCILRRIENKSIHSVSPEVLGETSFRFNYYHSYSQSWGSSLIDCVAGKPIHRTGSLFPSSSRKFHSCFVIQSTNLRVTSYYHDHHLTYLVLLKI